MARLIITLIRLLHTLLLLFVLLACFTNFVAAWLFHLMIIPGLLLHWKTNNNTCYLTNLEHYLRKKWNVRKKEKEDAPEKEEKFVRGLILKSFGQAPSDHQVEIGIRVIMLVLWLVSLTRVLLWDRLTYWL